MSKAKALQPEKLRLDKPAWICYAPLFLKLRCIEAGHHQRSHGRYTRGGQNMSNGNGRLHINTADRYRRSVQTVIARAHLGSRLARRVWRHTQMIDNVLAGRPEPNGKERQLVRA